VITEENTSSTHENVFFLFRRSRTGGYQLTNVAPDDAPCRAGIGETAGLADCRAVHVPDGDRATVILQRDVGLAVTVEIAMYGRPRSRKMVLNRLVA
jgi:hypothetical protein